MFQFSDQISEQFFLSLPVSIMQEQDIVGTGETSFRSRHTDDALPIPMGNVAHSAVIGELEVPAGMRYFEVSDDHLDVVGHESAIAGQSRDLKTRKFGTNDAVANLK